METGTIIKWNEEKGFGFIQPKAEGKDIFFHVSNYGKSYKKPYEGLLVQYFISEDASGRKGAYRVCPVTGHKNNAHSLWQQVSALLLNLVLISTLYFLYSLQVIPLTVPFFYMIINVVTFGIYVLDKSAAQNDTWRTSEDILHILSLLGGWPAAAFAQSFLRHKSKKRSFRNIYWLTVVLNCAGLFILAIASL